jgi:hypothetical protein
MSSCSCEKIFGQKGTVHRVIVVGASSTGTPVATSSRYTKGKRVIAEAKNTKAHYPGNMLSAPSTGVINCAINFAEIDYSSLDYSLNRKCSCL